VCEAVVVKLSGPVTVGVEETSSREVRVDGEDGMYEVVVGTEVVGTGELALLNGTDVSIVVVGDRDVDRSSVIPGPDVVVTVEAGGWVEDWVVENISDDAGKVAAVVLNVVVGAEVVRSDEVEMSSEETPDTTPTVVSGASSTGVEVEGTVVGDVAMLVTVVVAVVEVKVVVLVVVDVNGDVVVLVVDVEVELVTDFSNSFKLTRHFSNCPSVTFLVMASIWRCVNSIFSAVFSSSIFSLQYPKPLILWLGFSGPSQ
jgi:hypothetical protein